MDVDRDSRVLAYVVGFSPPDYSISVTINHSDDSFAPLVTIRATDPSHRKSVSYRAQLHQVIDVSYMQDIGLYLMYRMRKELASFLRR